MNRVLLAILAALLGAGAMYFFAVPDAPEPGNAGQAAAAPQVWTCSMHPQVRTSSSGDCPICGMPLIPANSSGGGEGKASLTLSEHALSMASVETVALQRRELVRELRSVGKIQPDETKLASIVTRVDGYVEKLHVNFTGEQIRAGAPLVEIYSPELSVAQKELLLARSYTGSANLIDSTKNKLRQWGITDAEIERVIKSGQGLPTLTFYSPVNGTVIEKMVVDGSSVKTGDVLYRIANLESVWAFIEIYESELAVIALGQEVEATAEAFPEEVFRGKITFISPVLNEETRTVKIRVSLDNKQGRLKPGMFVHATLRSPYVLPSSAVAGAQPVTKAKPGQYYCPMCPDVASDTPAKCPDCGMNLEKLEKVEVDLGKPVAVPVSAVLDSGLKQLVYVEKSRGVFVPAEVKLGPRAGNYFPVISGLKEGDRVAVRGNFLIDSQFQVEGQSSLFNDVKPAQEEHACCPKKGAPPDKTPEPATSAPASGHKH